MTEPTKRCGRCTKHQPLDAFRNDASRKDGKYPTCKKCQRNYTQSTRGKDARRRWIVSGGLERARDYAKTPAAKVKRNERLKSQRRETQKRKVRAKTRNAVEAGLLHHPTVWACLGCHNQASEYHHHNYRNPLDVTPLCRECHVQLHTCMRSK